MLNELITKDMSNILIIAPHADDEILGCGATMAKEIARGNNVYVLVCTNAHIGAPELFSEEIIKQVRSEALSSHAMLGVKETIFLEFPAPALDQYPRYIIANKIAEIIRKYYVDTVYIPHWGDCHKDHEVIHDCAMVACRPLSGSSVKRVYSYETLSETEWGEPSPSFVFIPTRYVTFTKEQFDIKLRAMAEFKSQLRDFPSSRSLEAIEALAKFRGATVSSERAEAFMTLREID